jgi:hypothetical protein
VLFFQYFLFSVSQMHRTWWVSPSKGKTDMRLISLSEIQIDICHFQCMVLHIFSSSQLGKYGNMEMGSPSSWCFEWKRGMSSFCGFLFVDSDSHPWIQSCVDRKHSNHICPEHVQTWSLSLFPAQHMVSTIYITFTFYWLLQVVKRWFKAFGKRYKGDRQMLDHFI